MFYPELLTITSSKIPINIINELDTWFAFLTRTEKNLITASKLSIKLGIDYTIASALLNKCCEIGLLEKYYAIKCPLSGCETTIASIKENELYEKLEEINYCYACDNYIQPTLDDIFIIYKLIKNPTNSPDKIKKKLNKQLNSKPSERSLKDDIQANVFSVNDILYAPSDTEIAELRKLYKEIDIQYSTTKETGDALELFSLFLLKLVKCFKVAKDIRSKTNQFDVLIRNTMLIKSTILEEFGSHLIVECKNEKKKPDNTYYHKLIGVLQKSDSRFGIVFSKLPPTSTCNIIARETFLKDKIIVINIDYDDMNNVSFGGMNFLDMIDAKVLNVKINPTKDIAKSSLFSSPAVQN